MKRNAQKRRIHIAVMRAIFPGNSDVSLSAEMEAATAFTQKGNIMAEYGKYSHPRAHLKFEDRERLGKAWNNGLRTKPGSISILAIAKAHGVSRTLWRRELQRCTSGAILTPDIRRRGKHERRFVYIEYDAEAAGWTRCRADGAEDHGANQPVRTKIRVRRDVTPWRQTARSAKTLGSAFGITSQPPFLSSPCALWPAPR